MKCLSRILILAAGLIVTGCGNQSMIQQDAPTAVVSNSLYNVQHIPPDPFVTDCEAKYKVKDYHYVIKKYLEAKSGKIPGLRPESLDNVVSLVGSSYEKTGHLRQALPYYRLAFGKSLNRAPNGAVCHYGDLCMVGGDYPESKRAYIAVMTAGSMIGPPSWPFKQDFDMEDYPEKWQGSASRNQMVWEGTHPNPPTPLYSPKLSNPTFNQARAIAYFIVGQRAIYTESYPTDIAYLKIAAQLYPTSPEILWQYAKNLHAIHQDKSAFIEYDLAEKAATGDVKEAIHELRRQDNLEVRAAYFEGNPVVAPLVRVWKDRTASDFKNFKLAPYNLNEVLNLPKGINALKP